MKTIHAICLPKYYSHARHTRSARANWRGDAPAASTRLARRHLKNLEGGTSISPDTPK